MTGRRWTSLLAMLGVLLHAGVFVRHNVMMAGIAIDRAALVLAFGEICLSKTDAAATPSSADVLDVATPLAPDGQRVHCPDCLGAAGSILAEPTAPAFHTLFYSIGFDALCSSPPLDSAGLAQWPPARAPPSHA